MMKGYCVRKLAHFFSSCVSFIYQFVPWFFNALFGRFFSFLWVDILRIRKAVVYSNIDIAFPGLTTTEKYLWMKESLYVLTRNLFDLLKVPYLSDEWIDANVVIEGIDNLPKNHNGFFFLTLHLASGDLAAAIVSRRIAPLSLISKRFSNVFMDEFWFSLRQKSNTQFIDAHSQTNAFDILKALKAKRGVVFVLDQYMGVPFGIETTFFGRRTGTAYGLALFAKKTKRPVVPLYSFWRPDGRLGIVIRPEIDLSVAMNDDKNGIQRCTQAFNDELEKIVRLHPEQWMWVHRRWKEF